MLKKHHSPNERSVKEEYLSDHLYILPRYKYMKYDRRKNNKGENHLVIYEREHDWVMIPQHHHGLLSGDIARHWNDTYLDGTDLWNEVIFAIAQHDRAWIDLDELPVPKYPKACCQMTACGKTQYDNFIGIYIPFISMFTDQSYRFRQYKRKQISGAILLFASYFIIILFYSLYLFQL